MCCTVKEPIRLSASHCRAYCQAASSAYGCKSSNLISEPLGLDDCNLLCNSLVGVKVKCEPVVVLLNDGPRGLLDGLCTNATLQQPGCSPVTDPSPVSRVWQVLKRRHTWYCVLKQENVLTILDQRQSQSSKPV